MFIPLPDITFKNTGTKLIAKIKGIDSIKELKPLVNNEIYILKKELPILEVGEYYCSDLIGCKCYYEGKIIGEVRDIVDYGAGELFEVESEGGKTYFIPFLKDRIISVSIDNKSICFRELEGFI
jgi:16S rRNA processing protein RimM